MNNHDEIVRDAYAVRDDGAQPRFEVHEYECSLLTLAREDEGFTEDGIAAALARIAAGNNDAANALIFASGRKRDAVAAASVGKRAEPSPVAEDAERVAKSGTAPRYSRDDYHDEMMRVVKAEARRGEDAVSAFARLCGEGRFDELYAAGERAEVAEVEAAMAKAAPEDRFYPMLLDMAKMRRAPGETIEAACARLLERDPVVRDAYAATQGL